jgi:aspartate-alanine antiporter
MSTWKSSRPHLHYSSTHWVYTSGPQFFGSLGRKTLNQVHLAVFSTLVVFVTIWGLAQVLDLDKGTAAGLLAGATTESASIGTAGEALRHLGLSADKVKTLETNIAVTYAITYLFGMLLVIFFSSRVAPRLLTADFKASAKELEKELGADTDDLGEGEWHAFRDVTSRVYWVQQGVGESLTIASLEEPFHGNVIVERVVRESRQLGVSPTLALEKGDRVALTGKREPVVKAGTMLGPESGNLTGMSFVEKHRDVVITRKDLVGITLRELTEKIDLSVRRGVYAVKLTRVDNQIEMRPGTQLQSGDVITLVGPADQMQSTADALGYLIEPSNRVDYVYLGLGIIAGILLGMISVPIAGSPISLGIGGGCLISGLVFGWLRAKHPTFGSLPSATALHLRDFGLAIFIASVGLAAGPQALTMIQKEGLMLPVLAFVVVLTPLIASTFYAKYVLKMSPAIICGALAGLLTCTAGLNAVVVEADSETPVLGYTVPYAIANVLLTLLGPVIVLTV